MKEDILFELMLKDIILGKASQVTRYYDTVNLFILKSTALSTGARYYWLSYDFDPASFRINKPALITSGIPCWKPLIP